MYQNLQILNTEFNSVFSKVLIPALLGLIVICTQIILIFGTKFHYQATLLHYCLFLAYTVVSFLVIVYGFPLTATVYHLSVKFTQEMETEKDRIVSRYSLRTNLRWSPLKVRMWNISYFQRSTSLAALGIITYSAMRIGIAL